MTELDDYEYDDDFDDDVIDDDEHIDDEDYEIYYEDDDESVKFSLADSVMESVNAAGDEIGPEDQGTVHLAIRYARQIDIGVASADPAVATKSLYLGPQLLAALKELRLTPAARVEELGKNPTVHVESASAKARERAEARKKARENKTA